LLFAQILVSPTSQRRHAVERHRYDDVEGGFPVDAKRIETSQQSFER
jgi:hypothetical protein